MAKLIQPDGRITSVSPQYPAGFLPSEFKKLLQADEYLFIPLNDELFMIVAFENADLPKNEAATLVVRKTLRDCGYKHLKGPALLANTHDLHLWLLQPPNNFQSPEPFSSKSPSKMPPPTKDSQGQNE